MNVTPSPCFSLLGTMLRRNREWRTHARKGRGAGSQGIIVGSKAARAGTDGFWPLLRTELSHAACLRLRRQPSKPNAPTPAAKSGSAAGYAAED